MSEINDTICAVATGNNPGAIGVIRVSGKNAKEIVANHFSRDLSNTESRHALIINLRQLEPFGTRRT